MEQKQKQKIKATLRQVSRYMPQKKVCRDNAIHLTEKGVRGGNLYMCSICGLCFKINEIEVDHIEPVMPLDRDIVDWNEYISRLFCEVEGLQVLCKDCHQIKSNEENANRI